MTIGFYVNKILIVEWCSDKKVRIAFKNPIDKKRYDWHIPIRRCILFQRWG